jgi:hypothetical protein
MELNLRKYSVEETRIIFNFLKKNDLYRFMKGLKVYRRMEELRVIIILSVKSVAEGMKCSIQFKM